MRKRLVGSFAVTAATAVILAAPASAMASPNPNCNMPVVDTSSLHLLGNDPSTNAALDILRQAGATPYVRVTDLGRSKLDGYEAENEAACPTWNDGNGRRKPTLITLVIGMAPSDRGGKLFWGSHFDSTLKSTGGGDEITSQILAPRLHNAMASPQPGLFVKSLNAGLQAVEVKIGAPGATAPGPDPAESYANSDSGPSSSFGDYPQPYPDRNTYGPYGTSADSWNPLDGFKPWMGVVGGAAMLVLLWLGIMFARAAHRREIAREQTASSALESDLTQRLRDLERHDGGLPDDLDPYLPLLSEDSRKTVRDLFLEPERLLAKATKELDKAREAKFDTNGAPRLTLTLKQARLRAGAYGAARQSLDRCEACRTGLETIVDRFIEKMESASGKSNPDKFLKKAIEHYFRTSRSQGRDTSWATNMVAINTMNTSTITMLNAANAASSASITSSLSYSSTYSGGDYSGGGGCGGGGSSSFGF